MSGLLGSAAAAPAQTGGPAPAAKTEPIPRNVIFIMSAGQRYDGMGFLKGEDWRRIPQLDRMAREGYHLPNTLVTTALCSPSRASSFTGQCTHRRRNIDNNTAIAKEQALLRVSPASQVRHPFTGNRRLAGKIDDPQRFSGHWISFRGQRTYLPAKNALNISGAYVKRRPIQDSKPASGTYRDLDVVILRELTENINIGIERSVDPGGGRLGRHLPL